jgi:leucyl aminopeptidase
MTSTPPPITRARDALAAVELSVVRTTPRIATALGVPVATKGAVPRQIGLGRAALEANGFTGRVGQVFTVPQAGSGRGAVTGSVTVAVGIGDPGELDVNGVRTAAAAFARAAGKHRHLATSLTDVDGVDARAAGQAVVEGVLLGSYRYVGLKTGDGNGTNLSSLALVAAAGRARGVEAGVERGAAVASAAALARDLANTPPTYLNARELAALAVELGSTAALTVEVFDKDKLAELGCGGLLGVNRGSTEPPRMVKLSYRPRNPVGHLAMVGKGIMYDSGGISLKPSDAMHAVMKMDMSGAAAVLSAMTALKAARCRSSVTAWLMCTDNMPSGSALKLGDVLTIRNGKTVEIHNTDAEGRLVLADGLSLAVEDGPDAIVDIATLTGAALVALGKDIAAVLGTNQAFVDQVSASSAATDEPVWQLPLATKRYRKLLDSVVADMKNIGGPYGGTITAAVFLGEFVGDVPWAHLDIAGPMAVDGDDGILSKGATGFGTRLLIDLACNFEPPERPDATAT